MMTEIWSQGKGVGLGDFLGDFLDNRGVFSLVAAIFHGVGGNG